jgi:hypothetical protein
MRGGYRGSAPGRLLRDLSDKDIDEILKDVERRDEPAPNQTQNELYPPPEHEIPMLTVEKPYPIRNSVSAPGALVMPVSPVQQTLQLTLPSTENTTNSAKRASTENTFVFVQYDPDIRTSPGDRGNRTLMQRGDTFAKKKTVFDNLKNRFDLK